MRFFPYTLDSLDLPFNMEYTSNFLFCVPSMKCWNSKFDKHKNKVMRKSYTSKSLILYFLYVLVQQQRHLHVNFGKLVKLFSNDVSFTMVVFATC